MSQDQPAMRLDPDQMDVVVERLEGARDAIGGILAMIEQGQGCADIVARLVEVSTALDRAGFGVIAVGLRQCVTHPEAQEMDATTMERLFLSLA